MEFKSAYYSPMDRAYQSDAINEVSPQANIEEPIFPISEIGQTVTEGARFGTFLQTAKSAMWAGAGQIELSTNMGGGAEAVGAESYGKEARETLREMVKVNEVKIVSIHTPTNIGNLSGFNPQQGNFSDEYRKIEMREVKSAVRFAAEAAQGGAVVIHTGEYHRPIFDAEWNQKEGKWKDAFYGYKEEAERAVKPLVDVRTGRLIQEVRMNQLVAQAIWNRYEEGSMQWKEFGGIAYKDEKGVMVKSGDYIDYEGHKLKRDERMPKYDPETGTFVVTTKTWKDFVGDAVEMNEERAAAKDISIEEFKVKHPNEYVYPEEAFMYATTETQEKIALGWAGNYARGLDKEFKNMKALKKAREYYKKIEEKIPEDERWRIKIDADTYGMVAGQARQYLPTEKKTPVEIIDEALFDVRKSITQHKDMVTGQLQSAKEQTHLRANTVSAKKYAFEKSMESYAEAGIYAMSESMNNPYVKRDVFLSPENIWPEMGFGSHPEELIKLVKTARKRMADQLMDPDGPWKMSQYDAVQRAERHIKSTFDTQHLGMWIKHFKGNPGENEEDRIERFNDWYMDMVKKMADENIIGYVHLVDGYGGGHQHLPAGQGIFPVVEAMKELKRRGFKGYINSEGHGEERHSKGRILVEAWRAFGSPISSGGYDIGAGQPRLWTDIHQSYFGQNYPPKFIFGAYSPSNDWTLWSQVPME